MIELTACQIEEVSGGRKFRFHFNIFQAVMAVCTGVFMGGPVGLGIAVCGLVGTQGLGQLHDLAVDEFGVEPIQ